MHCGWCIPRLLKDLQRGNSALMICIRVGNTLILAVISMLSTTGTVLFFCQSCVSLPALGVCAACSSRAARRSCSVEIGLLDDSGFFICMEIVLCT